MSRRDTPKPALSRVEGANSKVRCTHAGQMSEALPLSQRAAELRRRFDLGFAEPPRRRSVATVDLLAIRLGAEPYALHLAAVGGLFAGKVFTRLPRTAPDCLGIAGFRGYVIPVYDLRLLLGCAAGEPPRWLVVVAGSPLALAFDGYDGHLRLASEAIAPQASGASARPHVREVAQCDTAPNAPLRPLIDMDSVVAAVRQSLRRDPATPAEEG